MTIKGDALEYAALKSDAGPVLTTLLRDMAELDRQTARLEFGASPVDPRMIEAVDKGIRELLTVLEPIVPNTGELQDLLSEVTGQ